MTVDQLLSSMSASEFEEHWESFLLNGFPSWLAEAHAMSAQYKGVKPRQILRGMISDWVTPDYLREMSDEDLENQFRLTAQRMGTRGLD